MAQTTANQNRELKPAGWFSRRHPTHEAHDAARAAYGTRRDRQARRQGVAEANQASVEHKNTRAHREARKCAGPDVCEIMSGAA